MTGEGKIIAIYGQNEIETARLTKGLWRYLKGQGIMVERKKWPYSPETQGKIKENLSDGKWIISDGYTGNDLVLGMADGIPLNGIEEANRHFREPDISLFVDNKDNGEERNPREVKERKAYRTRAELEGWSLIEAETPAEILKEAVSEMLKEGVLREEDATIEGSTRGEWIA